MSVVCTPYGEGGGGWPETRPSVLFRWLCWEERTPSLGLDGSEGRRRFFSPVLTLNTLPFIAWYLSVSLCLSPGRLSGSIQIPVAPNLVVLGTPTLSLPSLSTGFCLSPLPCPRSWSSSGVWSACPSISLCLPRTHGGRTRLLSPGLRSRTFSLLFLTQPYDKNTSEARTQGVPPWGGMSH